MPTEKSRTQKKNEDRALQKTGEKLVDLSEEELKSIEMPRELHEAILFAKTTKKHGAKRRQMQFIGSLMRSIDTEAIENALIKIEQRALLMARHHHETEALRDQLISGNTGLMDEIVEQYPDTDRQRLGQLVRSARKEKETRAPAKSSKKLFRYLKALMDAKER